MSEIGGGVRSTISACASLTTLGGEPSDSRRRFEFPLRFWRFLSSEMSRSGDGPQEGEHREDDQGSPIEGAAGTSDPGNVGTVGKPIGGKDSSTIGGAGGPQGGNRFECVGEGR